MPIVVHHRRSIRSSSIRRDALRGFTLIEVMVVIVILGVLAALVVPRIISRPDEARVVAAKQDLAVISQALKKVRDHHAWTHGTDSYLRKNS